MGNLAVCWESRLDGDGTTPAGSTQLDKPSWGMGLISGWVAHHWEGLPVPSLTIISGEQRSS